MMQSLPSRHLKNGLKSKTIRKRFLEYFQNENSHDLIKSSIVVPRFDFSTLFVQCGAQQFKRVLTGEEIFDYDKVVATQRCVKVDGINQSLNSCGQDPFRHSCFENLGNWSLRSYDEEEACKLAWTLLTSEPFSIPKNNLFVSYFRGDEQLNLPADEEVRDIWLRLGVPEKHILPSRNLENLWNLSDDGPWGTSSKIYVLLSNSESVSHNFQSDKLSSALELWSIGFVKYNKTDSDLKPLSSCKISTGMGLERLVAILQNEASSYHTDLFKPLFQIIHNLTGAPEYKGTFHESCLDLNYRRIVDFSRMITLSIADSAFPSLNSHVKRILHNALYISGNAFKQQDPTKLLIELSSHVAESLNDAFPEIGENLKQVHLVIENEQKSIENILKTDQYYWTSAQQEFPVLRSISLNEFPEIGVHFKYFMKIADSCTEKVFSVNELFNLCEKQGVDRSVLDKMAQALNCTINWSKYDSYVKKKPKRLYTPAEELILRVGIETDSSFKHNAIRKEGSPCHYEIPDVEARLLTILDKNEIVSIEADKNLLPENLWKSINAEVNIKGRDIALIFDKTNFTSEANRICYDEGFITFDGNRTLFVKEVKKLRNFMIHFLKPLDDSENDTCLKVGMKATLKVDIERRIKFVKNNTLSLLMMSAIKEFYPLAHFRLLNVNEKRMKARIDVVEPVNDTFELAEKTQERIREMVDQDLDICSKKYKNSFELLKEENVTWQPALKYPYKNLRLTILKDQNEIIRHSEPSDTTFLTKTSDIGDFYIFCTGENFFGVTEEEYVAGLELEKFVVSQIPDLKDIDIDSIETYTPKQLIDIADRVYPVYLRLHAVSCKTPYLFTITSYRFFNKIEKIIQALDQMILKVPRELLVESLRAKLEEIADRDGYAVHFCLMKANPFRNLSIIVDVVLNNKFPSFTFCTYKRTLKGLCHVPKNCIKDDFNAGVWVRTVIDRLGEDFPVQQEEEENYFCYMKGKKVESTQLINFVEAFTVISNMVAQEKFK